MTPTEIEAFLTVVRYGSVTDAAESLFITQPALSRRLMNLEKELGYTLFVRSPGFRRVTLTDRGTAFVPLAHKWQSLFSEAASLRDYTRNSLLRISSINSVAECLLPPVCRAFLDLDPSFRISYRQYHSAEACEHIENGELDLAFIGKPQYLKNGEAVPFYSEPMLLVSPLPFPDPVDPSLLDPAKELHMEWNTVFRAWYDKHVSHSGSVLATLETMSFWDDFLIDDAWSIMPVSVFARLREKRALFASHLQPSPPDRIIYCIKGNSRKDELSGMFLSLAAEYLRSVDDIRLFYS